MILSDRDIKNYIGTGRLKIEPLSPDTIRENGIDLRFSGSFARMRGGEVFNPGETDPNDVYEVFEMDRCVIEPGETVLISTLEYVKFPDDLMGFIGLRSSYARIGLSLPPTIIDAGFEGVITVGITSTSFKVVLKKGERILHVILARLSSPSENPYSGIYKGRSGLALPFSKPGGRV